MPDGPGPTGATRPYLIVHRPAHPNGMAVLVISGGGYAHIEEDKESGPAAGWLAAQGITAFELIYRLPGKGWGSVNVPFEDGQRAMRLIRSMADSLHIDKRRVGVMGFSAGGHLAGTLATQFDTAWYPPADRIDKIPSRPDFAVLLYPVISMLAPYNHTHSYKELVGKRDTAKKQMLYSVELHVTQRTPPTFLAQAKDDSVSPVQNSEMMYAALQREHISSVLHLFSKGGHGWGMGKAGTPTMLWPKMCKAWLAALTLK